MNASALITDSFVAPSRLAAMVAEQLIVAFPATTFGIESAHTEAIESLSITYIDGPVAPAVDEIVAPLRTHGVISITRRPSVEVLERISALLRRHYNCKTRRDIPDPARRYFNNKAPIVEVAETIWSELDLTAGFDPDAVVIRRPIVTATDLLRDTLATVQNDASEAKALLLKSSHPEASSARGILRRALKYEPGATHVRYSGGGGFSGIPPVLHIKALQGDGTPGVIIGTWDIEKYGRIINAYETTLQRVKDELAPDAKYISVDNPAGAIIKFHPPVRGGTGPVPPLTVPEATKASTL